MSTYQTDEEQVEAIKKWWKENGKSVVAGVVLGFGIIGGWQFWQGHQQSQGEQASLLFDSMRQAVSTGQADRAAEEGKRLIGEFGDSAYASFAALELARLAYEKGEKAVARNHLRWVSDTAADPSIGELARLRLGQLLLDIEDYDALQTLLGKAALPAYSGEFEVLRGDLAVARGDRDGAREAYQEAMIKGVRDESILRMKLVDVGAKVPVS